MTRPDDVARRIIMGVACFFLVVEIDRLVAAWSESYFPVTTLIFEDLGLTQDQFIGDFTVIALFGLIPSGTWSVWKWTKNRQRRFLVTGALALATGAWAVIQFIGILITLR